MAEEIENIENELEAAAMTEEGSDVVLQTHLRIDNGLSGDIVLLKKGYAKVILRTNEEMRADNLGLVHGGFVFSAADYAVMAAVNEPNVVLAGSNCLFLAPSRVGDEITFEAEVRHTEGRKRNVQVRGYAYDVKIFEGEFKTVVTEKHVLRLSLLHNIDDAE